MSSEKVEQPISYRCSSCHCKRGLADFIHQEKMYKSCQRCRANRVVYQQKNREEVKVKRYGNKERETCPCGALPYYLYCKEAHLTSQRHMTWANQKTPTPLI